MNNDEKHIEFISYTGKYPALCYGVLTLKIDNEEVAFGFDLNDREKNIIRTHMFPINLAVPRYLESWLVSIVDKGVAFYEFYHSYSPIFRTAINYLYFFILFSLYRAD